MRFGKVEHLSPEERLLQLIRRRPKKEEAAPLEKTSPSVSPGPPKAKVPSVEKTSSLRPHLGDFLRRKKNTAHFFQGGGEGEVLSLFKRANQILGIGFGVLVFLFLTTFTWGKFHRDGKEFPREEMRLSSKRSPLAQHPFGGESSRKPYTYYAEDIEKRNIFGPSLYTETPSSPGEPALKESVKDLNLLGIVSGKNPQAIIEDKKEGKTHFVNKGDAIGFLRVEEITEDKVILNYRGERVDLAL